MSDTQAAHLINPKLPVLWHGGDYNPEQWPQAIWDEDMHLMQVSHCNVATIGVFSWTHLEPKEGHFEFGWMDEVIEKLSRAGRHFILATPSAAPPAWLSLAYPETLRTGPDRVRRLHGNRVNYNLGSPIYRKKCKEIATHLAKRYGAHPNLLAWHLSNEYGGADYGPESTAQFREWLRTRYKSLDALNHAYWASFWGHTFTNWNEIDPPGGPLGEISIQALTVDWNRFVTDQTVEFMLNEAAPFREISPDVPITTNFMGTYPGLNYRKFTPHIDFTCWDSYPSFETPLTDPRTWIVTAFKHDLTRSLKPDKPWLLMESTPSSSNWYEYMTIKRPGMHHFEGLQAIAHGSQGVQYFQWRQSRGCQEQLHGAVVSHSGAENARVFREVRDLGSELESLSGIAGSEVRAEVAVVYDWESRWALEAACGPTQRDKKYEATCIDHYEPFWQAGIPVDIVGLEDDLDRYKLVVAPMAYSLPPGFAERVSSFVENGGTFVTTYLSGWTDENSLIFEGGFLAPLRRLLGLWSEELDVLRPADSNSINVANQKWGLSGSYVVRDFCEIVHCETAEAIGRYADDFYAQQPALTLNRYGKGQAIYIAARPEQSLLNALLPTLALEVGAKPVLEADLPPGVTAQARHKGGKEFLFLLNATGETVTVDTREFGRIDLAPHVAKTFAKETVPVGK